MAKKTASERDQEAKRLVRDYLLHVQLVKVWSQSEIARRMGAHPSSANKAFAGKHLPDLQRLLVLADESGIPVPQDVMIAYKALSSPATTTQRDIAAFLEGSPEMRRMVELARQLDAASAETKKAIQREMRELITKVS